MKAVTRTGIVLTTVSLMLAPVALAAEKKAPRTEPKTQVSKHETKVEEGKEVTLTGKVVDLACWSTHMSSTDHAKCTAECLKAGVPAALETPKGLVMLGKGHKGCGEMMAEHAWKEVKVKGKLYERSGVKYLDVIAVEKPGTASARPADSKAQTSAAESRRNVRIYPPGELSKAQMAKPTVKPVKSSK